MQKQNITAHKPREPQILSRTHDRIKPGEYYAIARTYQVYLDSNFRRWICALQFSVCDNQFNLTPIAQLTRFLNLGEGKQPKATSRRSHFWRAWVQANGGPPKHKQHLSPAIFLHRLARVTVDDVKHDYEHRTLPGNETYSVVTSILNWETGTIPGSATKKPTTKLGKRAGYPETDVHGDQSLPMSDPSAQVNSTDGVSHSVKARAGAPTTFPPKFKTSNDASTAQNRKGEKQNGFV